MTRRRADLTLLLITVIWGTTFPIVHGVTQDYPPLALVALRFILGSLALLPLVLWRPRRREAPAHRVDKADHKERVQAESTKGYSVPALGEGHAASGDSSALATPTQPDAERRFGRRGWLVALALGCTLYAGFALQTIGLQQTTASRGGFITGLNVLIVPLLALLILRQRPALLALAGLALALAGMALLALDRQEGLSLAGLNQGDLLVLLCAFAFALHIVLISGLATALPAVELNMAQMVVVALLALATAPFAGGIPWPEPTIWASAAFLGLVATALVFALQIAAQRYTTPTHTALIFALEPVFAALFSALSGEMIGRWTCAGGALMVLGVLVAEAPGWSATRERSGIAEGQGSVPDS